NCQGENSESSVCLLDPLNAIDSEMTMKHGQTTTPHDRVKQQASNSRTNRRKQREQPSRMRMRVAPRDNKIIIYLWQRQQRRVEGANRERLELVTRHSSLVFQFAGLKMEGVS